MMHSAAFLGLCVEAREHCEHACQGLSAKCGEVQRGRAESCVARGFGLELLKRLGPGTSAKFADHGDAVALKVS